MKLTPDQFRDRMEHIAQQYSGDPEAAHSEADKLICDLLCELGYDGGISVFDSMELWYA